LKNWQERRRGKGVESGGFANKELEVHSRDKGKEAIGKTQPKGNLAPLHKKKLRGKGGKGGPFDKPN